MGMFVASDQITVTAKYMSQHNILFNKLSLSLSLSLLFLKSDLLDTLTYTIPHTHYSAAAPLLPRAGKFTQPSG